MNIRKIFNLTSPEQKFIIQQEIAEFNKIVEEKVVEINTSEKNIKIRINSSCPKCGGDITVNKIANVVSEQRNIIETKEINHCCFCGNQWKKYEGSFVTKLDIERRYANILTNALNNDEKNEDFFILMEKINLFCAETIYQIINKRVLEWYEEFDTVKMKTIRKYFKSIFNK